jgi:hypothetical protein
LLEATLPCRQLNVIWLEDTSLDAAYCTDYRSGWFCYRISIITFQRWFCWFQSYHGLEGIRILGWHGGGGVQRGIAGARLFFDFMIFCHCHRQEGVLYKRPTRPPLSCYPTAVLVS